MPAYNEEGKIAECVAHARAYLESLTCTYEIIIVDDGSTDGTRADAIRVSDNPCVRVVGYDRNRGKGFAISDTQSGFKAFRCEALDSVMSLVSAEHYAFDVALLLAAELRIIELPIKIHLSSLFSVRYVFRMFVYLLGITYRLRVIHWYQKNLHNRHAVYKPIVKW
jgi:hypothetical protein